MKRPKLLLIMAITVAGLLLGTAFAFALQPGATVTITPTSSADFATVADATIGPNGGTDPSYTMIQGVNGQVNPGDLFEVTFDTNYPSGQPAIATLSLTNISEFADNLFYLTMEIQVYEGTYNGTSWSWSEVTGADANLSTSTATVDLEFTVNGYCADTSNPQAGDVAYAISIDVGSFRVHGTTNLEDLQYDLTLLQGTEI